MEPSEGSHSSNPDLYRSLSRQRSTFQLDNSPGKYSDSMSTRARYQLFPTALLPGAQFRDLNDFKEYLGRAAEDKLNPDLKDMYRVRCTPNVQQPRAIRGKCRQPGCEASININFIGNDTGFFIVNSVNNQHFHPINEYKRQPVSRPQKRLSVSNRKQERTKRRQPKAVVIKSKYLPKLKNEPSVGEMRSFSVVAEFLKGRGYHCQCSRDYNPNTQTYPLVVFCAGSRMRRSYGKYNDLVYFDLYPNVIESAHDDDQDHPVFNIATFATADTNNRPLLLGFALTTINSAEAVYWAWELFIKTYKKAPRVMSLNYNSINIQAVAYMALGEIFTGTVTYRLWDFIKQVKKEMVGSESAVKESIDAFKRMADTTNTRVYEQCKQKLEQDEDNRLLFDKLTPTCSQIYLMELPSTFVGLRRGNPAERLMVAIKGQLNHRPYIIEALRRIELLDKKLSRRSYGPLDLFEAEVEEAFKDSRIKNVRTAFEKRIFEKFLENYIEGIDRYRCEKVPNKRLQFHVVNKFGDIEEEYIVNEWACNCKEAEKTGIPCPHLLLSARSMPEKGYVSFFSGRWRRLPPPPRTTALKAVIRKPKGNPESVPMPQETYDD